MTQQLVNGLFIGSVYALFAVGYTLIFGVLDILNLAHASIFAAGGIVAWWLVAVLGWNIVAAAPGTVPARVAAPVSAAAATWMARSRSALRSTSVTTKASSSIAATCCHTSTYVTPTEKPTPESQPPLPRGERGRLSGSPSPLVGEGAGG